jgi:hypothetical protein
VFRLQNVANTQEMNFDSSAQYPLVSWIRFREPLPADTVGTFNDQNWSPGNPFGFNAFDKFTQSPIADVFTRPGRFPPVNLNRFIEKETVFRCVSASGFDLAPTGKYLQVQTPGAVLTISHVAHELALPRYAVFREKGCKDHGPELFEEYEREWQKQIVERQALEAAQKKKHLVLIYGDQNLEFIRIGAMDPTATHWLEMPMNLLTGPIVIVDHSDDDTEGKDISIPMDVKAQFLQHLSENAE